METAGMKRRQFAAIILRPMGRGAESTLTWRRRMSSLGHLPRDTIILLLVMVRLTTSACAEDAPTSPRIAA
ncbi:peptidase S41, partial [Komagataeibacter melaceti]